MKSLSCKIIENMIIAENTYRLVFEWHETHEVEAGQFFNIQIDGFFLRRPISVCEVLEDRIVIIYKIAGEGTKKLSDLNEGSNINVMGPLGSSYPILSEKKVVLIGGGVGVPPMIELAKRYISSGAEVTAVLGFDKRASVFGEERLLKLGCNVFVATDDGSYGYMGNAVSLAVSLDGVDTSANLVCGCGPVPMLRAIEANFKRGYISFESRMACGIGSCMACVAKDAHEEELYHRICKEGPVFPIGRLKI